MAKNDGTFGFEDLQKAFNRIEQKYENKTDAMLMAMANVTRQRVRAKTPTGKTKKLKGSWRTKKPKIFGKPYVCRFKFLRCRLCHIIKNEPTSLSNSSDMSDSNRDSISSFVI